MACSIIGVFVGYLRTQKGYWVNFLNQHKYVVSFNITFFESTHYCWDLRSITFRNFDQNIKCSGKILNRTFKISSQQEQMILSSSMYEKTYLQGFLEGVLEAIQVSNPNWSLKLVLMRIEIIENSFDISTTLAKDFIASHSFESISSNSEGGWSHLDHTIIFANFMSYPIYDILDIPWLGIRKS